MKQKMRDSGGPEAGKTDPTSGDGVLKEMAAKAKAMAPALAVEDTGDPRRRGEIKVTRRSDSKYDLYIDNVLWSEVEWGGKNKMWCIQDCCGYCLSHVEHVHSNVPNDGTPDAAVALSAQLNATTALETAKKMIRDGTLPSPEDARAEYQRRTGHPFTNR
jgi:hypothetical protein